MSSIVGNHHFTIVACTIHHFFYGALQGDLVFCGVGGILYFYDTHFIRFKVGLVNGSNL
jgi:hypothetical protein